MKTVISKDDLGIKRIFHMADIQVRPLIRHDEFTGVFQNLYTKLVEHGSQNSGSCVVICGDIVQEKDKLKPETIMVLREFFKKLLEICKIVVVIAGNHDLIENNNDRLDNLTPILDDIGAYYLKDSGAYRFGNVVFGVSSIVDKGFIPRQDFQLEENDISVALYHGMLNGSRIDEENVVIETNFPGCKHIRDFEGYDYVMLGDIHRHQFLRDNVAYSGSLVQQNFGEPLKGHGFIKWDLRKGIHKFVEINNEYGFVNIAVNKGKLVGEIKDLPKKLYVRYHVKNTTAEEMKKFRTVFEKDLDVKSFDIRNIVQAINQVPVELRKNVDDTDLLKRELGNLEVDDLNFIIDYHQRAKMGLVERELNNAQYWKILRLEFTNMMIYGGDHMNVIDFTKLDGITSVCGKNAIGKSCIQKMLLFALFDRIILNAGHNLDKDGVLNKDSAKCLLNIEFLYGNDRYRIERQGKQRKRGGELSMEFKSFFYKMGTDGERICLNGEHRGKTDDEITKFLGIDFEDFLLTNLYSNTIYLSILGMKPTERLRRLNKYFRLEWYKSLRDKVKDDISKCNQNLQYLKGRLDATETAKTDIDKDDVEKRIKEILEEMNTCGNTHARLIEQKEILEIEINKLHEERAEVNRGISIDLSAAEHELQEFEADVLSTFDTCKNWDKKKLQQELVEYQLQFLPEVGDKDKIAERRRDIKRELKAYKITEEECQDLLVKLDERQYKLEGKTMKLREEIAQIKGQITVENAEQELQLLGEVDKNVDKAELQKELIECQCQFTSDVRIVDEILEEKVALESTLGDKPEKSVEDLKTLKRDTEFEIRRQRELLENFDDDVKEVKGYNISELESMSVRLTNKIVPNVVIKNKRNFDEEIFRELKGIVQVNEKVRKKLINALEKEKVNITGQLKKELLAYLKEDVSEQRVKFNQMVSDKEYNAEIDDDIVKNEKNTKRQRRMSCLEKSIALLKLQKYLKKNEAIGVCQEWYIKDAKLKELCAELRKSEKNEELRKRIEELREQIEKYEKYKELEKNVLLNSNLEKLQKKLEKSQEKCGFVLEERDKLRSWKDKKMMLTSLDNKLEICENNEKLKGLIDEVEEKIRMVDKYERRRVLEENIQLGKRLKVVEDRLACRQEKYITIVKETDIAGKQLAELTLEHDRLNKLMETQGTYDSRTKELKEKIIESEKMLNRYKLYERVVSVNGLPLKLMEKKLEDLCNEINQFLCEFVSFNMKFSIDNSKLLIHAHKDGIKLGVADLSGYETFVLNLAFKFALSRHNFLGTCALLCIDEGLDCIDEYNFEKLGKLFDKLRTQYEQIMVISHMPEVRKFEDHCVKIEKCGKYSRIVC